MCSLTCLVFAAIATATITIFARCIFRVLELNGGFNGPLANNEVTFMILEGPMIIIASAVLTVFHPGICFRGRWHEADWNKGKKQAAAAKWNGEMSSAESEQPVVVGRTV